MPANKNQIRRIQTIVKMMRQNRYPNYPRFLKEMEKLDIAGAYKKTSGKTFQRDIADLRDEYGAPVHYDESRKGYYLSNTDWYNEDLMVEPFEMKAALLGERIASGFLPDPLRGEMNRAVAALIMKNENGMAQGVELENFQVINSEYLPHSDPEIFLTCYNAWEQHRDLKLTYASSKRVSVKYFEPHLFIHKGGSWYLRGKQNRVDGELCDPPKKLTLAIHRIESAEMTGTTFDPDPEILKQVKENGLFDFEKLPEAVIEFFAPFDKGICERYASAPEVIKERRENSVIIRLQNITEYEAAQIALSACGNAAVHAPAELQLYMVRIANKILENSGR
ncbi:MAG: WYL domain-containing protein [Lentisphaerae bacterium]|nr:WYL domain-containing protein [Lentisphaerota bacterium]